MHFSKLFIPASGHYMLDYAIRYSLVDYEFAFSEHLLFQKSPGVPST